MINLAAEAQWTASGAMRLCLSAFRPRRACPPTPAVAAAGGCGRVSRRHNVLSGPRAARPCSTAAAAGGTAVPAVDGASSSDGAPREQQHPQPDAQPAPAQLRGLLNAWKDWWQLLPPTTSSAPHGAGSGDKDAKEPPPQQLPYILGKVAFLLRPDLPLLLAALAFLCAAAMCDLAIPALSTRAVFAAARERASGVFERNLALLAAATAGYAFFAAIRGGLFALINTNLLQRLRSRVFERLICQPVSFFDAAEPAQLTSRLAADCSVISRVFSTSINVALRNALQMTGALVAVCSVLVVVAAVFGGFSRRAQRTYQDKLAASNEVAEESFKLARLIRAFGTEAASQQRYGRSLGVLRRISLRQSAAYALYVCCNNFLHNSTRLATLLVGGTAAIRGAVTAQQLTEFVMFTEFIASALLSVCDQWGPIMEGAGAAERILTYLDSPPAPQIASGAIPGRGATTPAAAQQPGEEESTAEPEVSSAAVAKEENGGSGGGGVGSRAASSAVASTSGRGGGGLSWRVDFRGVTFSYPTRPGVKALDDVTLTIPAGQLTALVGLSGSGKSTLISLVERLYDPGAGAVLLDGWDLRTLDAAWFRSRVGVVSQEPHLFHMTVAENIALGFEGATRADIERAARLANAYDFVMGLPQGFDTPVSDKLLSGGQRQRVAIARALVRDPALLILDEATSALDAESEAAVQEALDRAMRTASRTIIVIAHRLATVRHADQILVMSGGRVVEQGRHSQLMRQGGIYAALVKRQSGAVLDQERDLAPHERQDTSAGGSGSSSDGRQADRGGDGDADAAAVAAAADAEGAAEGTLPDSLPQWAQQRREPSGEGGRG